MSRQSFHVDIIPQAKRTMREAVSALNSIRPEIDASVSFEGIGRVISARVCVETDKTTLAQAAFLVGIKYKERLSA